MSPLTTVDITSSAGLGGSISPLGTNTVATGTSPVYTVTPMTGFSAKTLLVDGNAASLTNGTYTFTNVQANHTISVTFIADTYINVILDSLVVSLSAISTAHGYRTNPLTVKRHSSAATREPLPLILVRCQQWGPNEPMTGGMSWVSATIEVDALVQFAASGVDDPERELHRIMADIAQCVEKDWQLAATSIDSLSVFITSGYQPMKEMASLDGMAGGTLTFEARFQWSSTAL